MRCGAATTAPQRAPPSEPPLHWDPPLLWDRCTGVRRCMGWPGRPFLTPRHPPPPTPLPAFSGSRHEEGERRVWRRPGPGTVLAKLIAGRGRGSQDGEAKIREAAQEFWADVAVESRRAGYSDECQGSGGAVMAEWS